MRKVKGHCAGGECPCIYETPDGYVLDPIDVCCAHCDVRDLCDDVCERYKTYTSITECPNFEEVL